MMNDSKNFYRASAADFAKVPGMPIVYWASNAILDAFTGNKVSDYGFAGIGMRTGDNNKFLRFWHEVSYSKMLICCHSKKEQIESGKKWIPYNKGGEYRKWYGNNEYVVNWFNDGYEIKKATLAAYPQLSWDNLGWKISNETYYYQPGITWSGVTSGDFSCRCYGNGFIFDSGANGLFAYEKINHFYLAGLLNTPLANMILKMINPTINTGSGTLGSVPAILEEECRNVVNANVEKLVLEAKKDWDLFERSWDFASNPLVSCGMNDLALCYRHLCQEWGKQCEDMRRKEIDNYRIFLNAYGLQDEIKPQISWSEVTLTCNPWYRYGKIWNEELGIKNDELPLDRDLEERLRTDTVKELISYAVGCMMGRYSLDKPGLILADQGTTLADYIKKVYSTDNSSFLIPNSSFSPDADGIIPILDNDWFEDDIATRFKAFVKVAFGDDLYFSNIEWIEESLGKDIRSYFTKDFYKDHLQRYQNRPIYWMFQSPKGAFRALVYMHRYKPDMVGGVLSYLRSLQTKIDNQLEVAMAVAADETKSASERVRANKDVVKYSKAQKELDEYEKNVLYPLSTERVEIDLDDGVKVNYGKFGKALAKVTALEAKGE